MANFWDNLALCSGTVCGTKILLLPFAAIRAKKAAEKDKSE